MSTVQLSSHPSSIVQSNGLLLSMLMESQPRWSGHIARMPDYRLPKRVFFGELCAGNRSRGRPRKRYKDTLNVALKNATLSLSPGKCVLRTEHPGGTLSSEVFPTMKEIS